MTEIKSDISKTKSITATFESAIQECESISKPSKDERTTVSGNTNAHNAIDQLLDMNSSIAKVIRSASKNLENVGNEFDQTDLLLGNQISKN
ncbi:TIGR04197 family type VII secretion effector [Mammaliicoccus sp. Dog046]|uniref:TIGR04197 family type VII secretion effector n=1 Tax=Mammaliicoccus sp. Dog046 TaxID=3034233 RepID=UPI002B25763C|nr:TIGR04197 family type VII secretion effector [Mammaliicoccus sp. Dog046]WQK85565.1 TIGR04197 family type VII secretion effector [Mammaliicoccus sp. Dog046]